MRPQAYWRKERPLAAATRYADVSYFPEAGKLQIMQVYTRDGYRYAHKGVVLTRDELQANPAAVAVIRRFLNDAARGGA